MAADCPQGNIRDGQVWRQCADIDRRCVMAAGAADLDQAISGPEMLTDGQRLDH